MPQASRNSTFASPPVTREIESDDTFARLIRKGSRRRRVTGGESFGKARAMKKLIPLVLGVWLIAVVGCTTTETTTSTTTTRQTNATVDPTVFSNRPNPTIDRGPG